MCVFASSLGAPQPCLIWFQVFPVLKGLDAILATTSWFHVSVGEEQLKEECAYHSSMAFPSPSPPHPPKQKKYKKRASLIEMSDRRVQNYRVSHVLFQSTLRSPPPQLKCAWPLPHLVFQPFPGSTLKAVVSIRTMATPAPTPHTHTHQERTERKR